MSTIGSPKLCVYSDVIYCPIFVEENGKLEKITIHHPTWLNRGFISEADH
jgi:hypothetical protein